MLPAGVSAEFASSANHSFFSAPSQIGTSVEFVSGAASYVNTGGPNLQRALRATSIASSLWSTATTLYDVGSTLYERAGEYFARAQSPNGSPGNTIILVGGADDELVTRYVAQALEEDRYTSGMRLEQTEFEEGLSHLVSRYRRLLAKARILG